MAKDTFYTAIDIGNSKVASVVARVGTEGELKILGTGTVPSQGMQKGRIEGLQEVRAAVNASLKEAQRYIGRGVINGVYVGVSGTHLSCLNTKDVVENPGDVRNANARMLDQLVKTSYPQVGRNQEILHVIPMSYDVDGMTGVRNPVGIHAPKVQVEAHVVIGDALTLKNTVRAVEANQVTVKSLVLQSLAGAEATLTGDERETGAIFLDIGSGTSDLIIYREGSPWYSTVIPVGGNQLTKDLQVALKTSFYLAEEVKIKWGHAMPELVKADEEVVIPSYQGQPKRVVNRRAMAEPLQDRVEELLKLALFRMRESGLRQVPPGGLVISGGCADLAGMQELAEKTIGGPARIGYPGGLPGLPATLRKPAYSALAGLLLWGIKHHGEKRPYRNGNRSLLGSGFLAGRSKSQQKDSSKVTVG